MDRPIFYGDANLASQLQPGGPSLNLECYAPERGPVPTYRVVCDGEPRTEPAPWNVAAAAMRELQAHRAMAAETLRHTLSKKVA